MRTPRRRRRAMARPDAPPETRAAEERMSALIGPNDKWAITYLPVVRMAGILVAQKDEVVRSFTPDECAHLIEGFEKAGDHLLDLCDVLVAAVGRLKKCHMN